MLSAVLLSAAAAGTALANKVGYGAFLPGHPHRVVMSFYLVGSNCPWGPHCFDHAKVTQFGAGNYGYPNCPQLLEGAFEFGNPNTLKPTPVSVNKQLSFGGRGRSDTDFQIRVAFHGRFLKNRSKATGWFEVHNGYCSTGKLNWTATQEK